MGRKEVVFAEEKDVKGGEKSKGGKVDERAKDGD